MIRRRYFGLVTATSLIPLAVAVSAHAATSSVGAVPEPASIVIALGVASALAGRRGRARNLGCAGA